MKSRIAKLAGAGGLAGCAYYRQEVHDGVFTFLEPRLRDSKLFKRYTRSLIAKNESPLDVPHTRKSVLLSEKNSEVLLLVSHCHRGLYCRCLRPSVR